MPQPALLKEELWYQKAFFEGLDRKKDAQMAELKNQMEDMSNHAKQLLACMALRWSPLGHRTARL